MTAPTAPEGATAPILDHSVQRDAARVLTSANRLKLGVFSQNMSAGLAGATRAPGPPTIGGWSEQLEISLAAEDAGLELLVPAVRFKGFGGPSMLWDRAFDTFTWAAGLAQATSEISILSTVLMPAVHPVVAAKMGATIDHISGGRWGLNLVPGWQRAEFGLLGREMPDRNERYAYADEWIEIVKRLWAEQEPFDFSGRFFDLQGAESAPQPMQSPHPVLMNAGQSETGQAFATKHTDIIFINLHGRDLASIEGTVEDLRRAGSERDRKVAVWGNVHVLVRDSEREVEEYTRYYAEEMADEEAARRHAMSALDGDSASQDHYRVDPALLKALVTTSANYPIHGTPEQVVEGFAELAEIGLDGLTMVFVDYQDGIARYAEQLQPLMSEAGLRVDEGG